MTESKFSAKEKTLRILIQQDKLSEFKELFEQLKYGKMPIGLNHLKESILSTPNANTIDRTPGEPARSVGLPSRATALEEAEN